MHALDLETEATDPSMQLHAGLEPWRVRQGKARITSISVASEHTDKVLTLENEPGWLDTVHDNLRRLKGEVVYTHNGVFDIAWLITSLQKNRMGAIPQAIRDIRWRDTGLLCKWLINGQLAENSHFGYSLANLVATFLPDHPMTKFFVEMKNQKVTPGDNPEYWLQRGDMDAIMTLALAQLFQAKLSPTQRKGFLTEMDCLVPVANSWVTGIKIDQAQLAKNEIYFANVKKVNCQKLGIAESVVTSTKALPDLLYNQWGLPVIARTPKGAASCAGDTVKLLHYELVKNGDQDMADKLELLMEAKSASTSMSKYVNGMLEALRHTTDGYIYPAPRIFGTYTGRFTYSSTVMAKDYGSDAKGKRHKVSIAAHQIPRKDKMIRSSMVAPEGYVIYEADASGQESRIMAIRSMDETMIEIFQKDLNFHSMTGASIIGEDYDDFMEKYGLEGNEGGYFTEQRQLGKLTNLSCNYRIGGKALAGKAFLDYDTFMTWDTGDFLVKTFSRRYKGVPKYWSDVIWESKQRGYTSSFSDRRYKLSEWSRFRWNTESSAINHPIQGGGADMKEIAIKECYDKVPEAIFLLDLHDANFFYIPEDRADEIHKKLDHVLNNIDYESYWGFEMPITLPYESKRGRTFAEVK